MPTDYVSDYEDLVGLVPEVETKVIAAPSKVKVAKPTVAEVK